MFGPVEMGVDWDGHRVWKYSFSGYDIPLGSMCRDDNYAYFVGFEPRNGQRYAVYSTRRDYMRVQLIKVIRETGYREGEFTLSSGAKSNYYVDLRPCLLDTRHIHLPLLCVVELLTKVRANAPKVDEVSVAGVWESPLLQSKDLLCGVITSGLFLCGALVHRLSVTALDISAIYCRTENREHGCKKVIEGNYKAGQEVILIDDVATSGRSLFKVVQCLEDANLRCKAAVVVVDREEGARKLLAKYNVPLYSVLTASDLKELV